MFSRPRNVFQSATSKHDEGIAHDIVPAVIEGVGGRKIGYSTAAAIDAEGQLCI